MHIALFCNPCTAFVKKEHNAAIFKIETHLNHATDKTLHDIADTFDVGFEWLKFGDERYRKSPVNRKLIEWLMDHQEIRDQLWKKMMDEE